jgi:hypothetical protein
MDDGLGAAGGLCHGGLILDGAGDQDKPGMGDRSHHPQFFIKDDNLMAPGEQGGDQLSSEASIPSNNQDAHLTSRKA